MEPKIGEMISRYEIVGELGRGGMATVYKARDTTLGRLVAIKLILPGQQQTERFLKRFVREAKVLAQLSHPNILKVLDYGEYQGSPYLVTEFMPGGSLLDRMGRSMPAGEATALLLPVASALDHAHRQKIVHRDVKPQNILINESGQPMLADFGIAKLIDSDESQSLTGTGALVGSPSYMAPEQVNGRAVTARTDVYALGVIFFELVTGRKPFTASTPVEVSLKHLNEPIPKPRQIIRDLPHQAEQIIYKSMAKNPDDRYTDMMAFSNALEKIAGKKYVPMRPVTQMPEGDNGNPDQHSKNPRLPRIIVFGAVGLMIVLVVSAFLFLGNPPGSAAGVNGSPTTAVTAAATTTEAQSTQTPLPPTATQTPIPTKPTATKVAPTARSNPTITAAVSDKVITALNIKQVAELDRIEKVSMISLDWAPDGSMIVVAGSNALTLIDPVTMTKTGQIELGNEVPKTVTISSDSKQAFVLGANIRVFDLNKRTLLRTIPVAAGANSMALSNDTKMIAIGTLNNKVQVIHAEDGSVFHTNRSNFGGWSVAFSPDGSLVAGGTTTGTLMWETATGTWHPLEGKQEDLIKSLAFSPDGKLLAAGSNGKIQLWDIQSGAVKETTGGFTTLNSIDFSPDSKLLVVGSEDNTARFFSVVNGMLEEIRTLNSHTSPVFGVHFSPEGDRVVSGANEAVIRMWGLP